MHGGTNHWFLPTSLLQEAFHDTDAYPPDTTLMGEVFGGGIVRIESTNASYITGPAGVRYPGELLGHTPGARALLVQTGHSGRQVRARRWRGGGLRPPAGGMRVIAGKRRR